MSSETVNSRQYQKTNGLINGEIKQNEKYGMI